MIPQKGNLKPTPPTAPDAWSEERIEGAGKDGYCRRSRRTVRCMRSLQSH
jgi:hypothetical protein